MNIEIFGFVLFVWIFISSIGRSKINIMKNVFKGLKELRLYVLNLKYIIFILFFLYFYFGY